MHLKRTFFLLTVSYCLVLLDLFPQTAVAQTVSRTYYAQRSGEWKSPGMWRDASGAEGVPTLDDGVVIDGHTVSLDGGTSCSRVDILGNGLLRILSTGDLTVYGQVTVDRGDVTPNGDKGLEVVSGGNIKVRHAAEKEEITPCTVPSSLSLQVSNILTDGFLVSWDISDNSCVQSYEVRVVQGTDTVSIAPTFQNSEVVSGLTSGTSYTVIVRAISDGNEILKESQAVTTQTIVEVTPDDVTVFGERKKWHRIGVAINTGLTLNESSGTNPFLDYRYEVTFTHVATQGTYVVPGHYSGRLDAADGGTGGGTFRCYFAPDQIGEWNYNISFRTGPGISVDATANGTPGHSVDGKQGSFTVSPSDKTGRDHRYHGRLEYVGERYLRYADSEDYFLKGGADSPENFLAYEEFDNTTNYGNFRKSWSAHATDYESKENTRLWGQSGQKKGQEILGAVNYLAKKGMNVFSFIPMNIGGDDRNVFPYISKTDFERMDLSKLDQWERVFSYADSMGMYLHFKLFEIENDDILNGGNLGTERKLYFREMISRFGHHLALNWNLGEENDLAISQVRADGVYIKGLDPYDHLLVVHTGRTSGAHDDRYGQLTGTQSVLTGASMQINQDEVHKQTKIWIDNAIAAGKPWVVANDEQASGVPADDSLFTVNGTPYDVDDIRKNVLWGNLMAGGAGVEYYFGQFENKIEDFTRRDDTWDWTRHALTFFRENLPFWEMTNRNGLVGNTGNDNSRYCFAKEGDIYVVYLPNGGTRTLTTTSADFEVSWYDPRNGSFLSAPVQQSSTGTLQLSAPGTGNDWVALVKRVGYVFARPITLELVSARSGNSIGNISVLTSIADGAVLNLSDFAVDTVSVQAKIGSDVDNIAFDLDNGAYTYTDTGAPYTLYGETGGSIDAWPVTAGTYTLKVTASKGSNVIGERTFNFTFIDCDSLVTYYRDVDGDGVGVATDVQRLCSTESVPTGYVTVNGDCDDNDAGVSSGCAPVTGTNGGDILLIVGNTTLNTGDQSVKDRLENELNSTVTVVDDNVATTADANGKDLVMISSTVSSSAVNTGFNTLAVPVINWEQAFQDDLHMTANNSATDRGTATGQDQLILDSDVRAAPFQEGLSGTVTIYNTIGNVLWGVPQGNAIKVAGYTSGRYSLFAYEQGDLMRDSQTAPEKRVSLFIQDSEASVMTADGWTLFDNAVKWAGGFTDAVATGGDSLAPAFAGGAAITVTDSTSTTVTISWPTASDAGGILGYRVYRGGQSIALVQDTVYTLTGLLPGSSHTVGIRALDNSDNLSTELTRTVTTGDGPAPSGGDALFVVGSNPLNSGDAAFRTILETLGFNVGLQVVPQGGSPDATEAVGKDLVVISSTITSGDIGTAFRDVAVPVMVWEKDLLDDMGMNSGNRFELSGLTTLTKVIDGRNAPFFENITATADITVYTADGRAIGGVAAGNPIKILDAMGSATGQYAMYAYDTGDGMDGLVAPAKRVALFLNDTEAAQLTADGNTLVRNAILWAAGQPNVLSDTQVPTFPQGAALTATANGASSISLGWTAADDDVGVTFYNIYVADTLVATAGGTATGFNLGGLAASTNYSLKVRAGDGAGNLSVALSASAVTAAADTSTVPRDVLFVVADPSVMNGAESAIRTRLEGDNYMVTLQDDNGVTAANASGMDLVIISSTVVSDNVNTAFRDVAVPVINWEKSLLDEMNLATTQGNIDDSLALDINVPAIGHPLSAGLSGRVTVYENTVTGEATSNGRFLTGTPTAGAIDVASSGGSSIYFAYEQGAAMVGGILAPERRVAFFLWDVEAAHFTVQGWQLFDAAVAWAVGNTSVAVPDTEAPSFDGGAALTASGVTSSSVTLTWDAANDSGSGIGTYRVFQNGGQLVEQADTMYTVTGLSDSTSYRFSVIAVDRDGNLSDSLSLDVTTLAYDSLTASDILFVVGNTTLNTGDAAIRTRLEQNYNVTVMAGNGIQASDAFERDLVIISSTVSSFEVGNAFTNVPVPVINWEKGLLDELRLASTQGNVYGTRTLDISTDTTVTGHPLSAGLSGTVMVYEGSVEGETSSNGTMLAGTPGSNAISVASSGGNGVYFAYEKGVEMATSGFSAPEKRVAFFLWDVEAAHLTAQGWQLFDAAVTWAIGGTGTPIVADTIAPVFPVGASITTNDITDGSARLSWTQATDNVGVTGYRVFRNGTRVTEVYDTLYNPGLLADTTTYNYSVIAFDAIGNISDSLSATFTTLQTDTTSTPAIKEVLFVVGNTTLNTGDQAVKDRLENDLYCNVTVVDDNVATTTDANGKDLVMISSTVSSTAVDTGFNGLAIPVINWEQAFQDDLYMTINNSSTDRGTATGQTQLSLDSDTRAAPFKVGLTGPVTIYSSAGSVLWGVPQGNAIKVAYYTSGRYSLFAYDKDDLMRASQTAPERRVSLFIQDTEAGTLTTDGWTLFDNTIEWALYR